MKNPTQETLFAKPDDVRFIEALLCGVSPETRERVGFAASHFEAGGKDLLMWTGATPPPKDMPPKGGKPPKKAKKPPTIGAFVVPNLMGIAQYRAKAIETGKSLAEIIRFRGGVDAAKTVEVLTCAFAEIDDRPIPEQRVFWASLEEATGLKPTAMVLSGDSDPDRVKAAGVEPQHLQVGKSIHVFWALREATLDVWIEIQRAIIVIARSDTSLLNPDRLMRIGGVIGKAAWDGLSPLRRVQTLIYAEPISYDARDMLARLTAYAASLGIDDIEQAYRALNISSNLLARSKQVTNETDRAALVDLAREVRETRRASPELLERSAKLTPGRVGSGKGGGTTDVIYLPRDTVVYLASGRTITLGELRSLPDDGIPCYDPCSETPGASRPSGRAFPRWVYSNAGGGRVRYLPEGVTYEVSIPTSATPSSVDVDALLGAIDTSPLPEVTRPPKRAREWFRLDLKSVEAPIIEIEASLGSGKTTEEARWVREVGSALIITHRQALSRTVAQTFGVADYQELEEGPIKLSEVRKLVICSNSLPRLDAEYDLDSGSRYLPNLLIIEEASSQVQHLLGGTFSQTAKKSKRSGAPDPSKEMTGGDVFYQILDMAKDVIDAGGKVILSDAHRDGGMIKFAELMAGYKREKPVARYHATHLTPIGYAVDMYADHATIMDAAREDIEAGRRIVVACTSKSDAMVIAHWAESLMKPDGTLPVVLVHHKDQRVDARKALRDVHSSWSQPDVLIYSPTCDAGVSYDRSDRPYHRRYLLARAPRTTRHGIPSFGWDVPMQMSRRVRDSAVKVEDIRVWVDPRWGHTKNANVGEVRNELIAQYQISQAALKRVGKEWTLRRDEEHFELSVAVETSRRLRSAQVAEDLAREFQTSGATIKVVKSNYSEETAKAALAYWADLKSSMKATFGKEVNDADPLWDCDFEELQNSPKLITSDELARSVKRSGHIDMFGVDATAEGITANFDGSLYQRAQRLARTRAFARGDRLIALDHEGKIADTGFRANAKIQTTLVGLALKVLEPLKIAQTILLDPPEGGQKGGHKGGFEGSGDPLVPTEIGLDLSGSETSWQKTRTLNVESCAHLSWSTPPGGFTGSLPEEVTDAREVLNTWKVMITKSPAYQNICHLGGIEVNHESPSKLIGRMLEILGVKTSVRKVQIAKKQLRVYSIDLVDLANMLAITQRCEDRLYGRSVAPISQIDGKIETGSIQAFSLDPVVDSALDAAIGEVVETVEILGEVVEMMQDTGEVVESVGDVLPEVAEALDALFA